MSFNTKGKSFLHNPFTNNYLDSSSQKPRTHSIINPVNEPPPSSEDSLALFFNKETFSDCVVIDPITSKSVRCHMLVLAAHSDLFNRHFDEHKEVIQNANAKNPHRVRLPKPVSLSAMQNGVFESCLNYFYVFKNPFEFLLRSGLSRDNFFMFYSYFHVLNHETALRQIEEFAISNIVNPGNVVVILLDAFRFQSTEIINKCLEIIEAHFEQLIAVKENYLAIKELPLSILLNVLSSNGLNINKEDVVLHIILDYITHREKEEENQENRVEGKGEEVKAEGSGGQKEKDGKNQGESNLAPKNEGLVVKEKEVPPIKDKENKPEVINPPANANKEEVKADPKLADPHPIPKPQPQPASENLPNPPPHEKPPNDTFLLGTLPDLNELYSQLLKKYRLSSDEKFSLLTCCRLSHIDHDFLLKVSNLPLMSQFKHVFIDAISAKLLNYEEASSHSYSINLTPRESYKETVNRGRGKGGGIDEERLVKSAGKKTDESSPGEKLMKHFLTGQIEKFEEEEGEKKIRGQNYNNAVYKSNQGQEGKNSERKGSFIQVDERREGGSEKKGSVVQTHEGGSEKKGSFVQSPYSQKERREVASQVTPNNQQMVEGKKGLFLSNQSEVKQNHSNIIGETALSQSQVKQPFYRSDDISKIRMAQSLSPIEFVYKYDFDDNGAFYYLGSQGKTTNWVNPYEINLVDITFSSLGQGCKQQNFIGRECVNCCTKNEKNAFMSVDLKEGRELFPTSYTLRNRPSRKYVLMNWVLEASVNNNEWYIIDKRIHLTEDANFNSMLAREREELIQKGQTSTWGIDTENVEAVLSEISKKSRLAAKGFRSFRITQIMKNSDGEYNLCLSGFEIYGTGFGGKWFF